MNRLNQLIKSHVDESISNNEQSELVDILRKELVSKHEELEYYGNQLMTLVAENALLKQRIVYQGVS